MPTCHSLPLSLSLLLHFYSWRVRDKQDTMLSRTVLSSTSENVFWRWAWIPDLLFYAMSVSTRWKKAGFPAAFGHSLDSALLLMYITWTHHSAQTLEGTLLGARHLGYALYQIWTTGILHCTLLDSSAWERKTCNLTFKGKMSIENLAQVSLSVAAVRDL